MSDKEHLDTEAEAAACRQQIDRREFIRYSTLLGMSAGAAYMWAGKITGQPFAQPAMAQDMPKGGTIDRPTHPEGRQSAHVLLGLDSNVVRQVCGYLTRTGVDNVTRPHLARSGKHPRSQDLDASRWRTRSGTTASPFTAEDAAWNIKHCLDPKVGSSVVGLMKGYMLKEVDTGTKDDKGNAVMTTELWDANAIEVKDPKTLVLNLKEAQVAVPEHFFHYPFLMLDPAENGVQGGLERHGVLRSVELEVGRKAVLKRRRRCAGLMSTSSISSISATIPRRSPPHSPPSRSTASIRAISSSSISTRPWTTSHL